MGIWTMLEGMVDDAPVMKCSRRGNSMGEKQIYRSYG